MRHLTRQWRLIDLIRNRDRLGYLIDLRSETLSKLPQSMRSTLKLAKSRIPLWSSRPHSTYIYDRTGGGVGDRVALGRVTIAGL